MRRVFLSFLGLGSKKGEGIFAYDPTIYILDGRKSPETEFVQVAEIGLTGAELFDEVIIVATEKSKDFHFRELSSALIDLGVKRLSCILIEEDMSSQGQWQWFERILEKVQQGDHLTVDLTHGYRAIPIMFSTAISFLQKARRVVVEAVYYGAYEKDRNCSPIIDMKDFYLINEWAEGVSRLVEDADARRLATLVRETPEFHAGELNDPGLVSLLEDLTNRIRNVDMQNVCSVAGNTIAALKEKEASISCVGHILLKLVEEKYSPLQSLSPCTGSYDFGYFQGQLAFIRLLLDHKLYMQAFTVMRELVGSIGLIENVKAKTNTSNGRRQRTKAEVFINMIQFEESKWRFNEEQDVIQKGLDPLYRRLEERGICETLRSQLKALVDYRNGFDHGWTKFPQSPNDIGEKGEQFFSTLCNVVQELTFGPS